MASITIRNLDDDLKQSLRVRAAQNRRSMEDEVRDILRTTLSLENSRQTDLARTIRQRFAEHGHIALSIAPREATREPWTLGSDHTGYECTVGTYEIRSAGLRYPLDCFTAGIEFVYHLHYRGENPLRPGIFA